MVTTKEVYTGSEKRKIANYLKKYLNILKIGNKKLGNEEFKSVMYAESIVTNANRNKSCSL